MVLKEGVQREGCQGKVPRELREGALGVVAEPADVNYHPIGKYIRSTNILHIYKVELRKCQVLPF